MTTHKNIQSPDCNCDSRLLACTRLAFCGRGINLFDITKMEKMMFRLEFNEKQQHFHMVHLTGSERPEGGHGWKTICHSIEDRMSMEFINRMAEKYSQIGYYGIKNGKKAKMFQIEEDFVDFIETATNVDVIEIRTSKLNPAKYQCPVIYQKRNEGGVCSPCPYCGKRHIHSIGSGHRITHCNPKYLAKCFNSNGDAIGIQENYYIITLEP